MCGAGIRCGHGTFDDIICGDADLDSEITIVDATLIQRYDVNMIALSDTQLSAADVDKDGTIDSTDSLTILKYVVELIDEF